jgi:hypothetical protein
MHSIPVLQFGPLMDKIQFYATVAKEAHAAGEYETAHHAVAEGLPCNLSAQHILTGLRANSG